MNKKYLSDLEQKGVTIVESFWEKEHHMGKLAEYFDKLNCDEIIIKPNISGNADNTFRLNKNILSSESLHECDNQLVQIFKEREFMVQPFIKNIITEGEYSLFYFNGEYSHAILKKPKENDFRVQEEHGGKLTTTEPDVHLKNISENILSRIDGNPLYARIDLIRTPADEYALMELELIEPSLYFNMDNEAAKRFASAFDKRMKLI
jgi:hypothetical protein